MTRTAPLPTAPGTVALPSRQRHRSGVACFAAIASIGALSGCSHGLTGDDLAPAPNETTVASAPAATTSPPPVGFTRHLDCGPEVRAGSDETVDGGGPIRIRHREWAWQPSGRMSDPRLEGTYLLTYDSDDYRDPAGISVGAGTWRIENSDGAWQGSFTNLQYPDSTTVQAPHHTQPER